MRLRSEDCEANSSKLCLASHRSLTMPLFYHSRRSSVKRANTGPAP